jgi:hypothetical protein
MLGWKRWRNFGARSDLAQRGIRRKVVAGTGAPGRPAVQDDPAKLRLAQASMGQRDTNVAELCAELGITRSTLYRHVDPTGQLRPDGAKLLARKGGERPACSTGASALETSLYLPVKRFLEGLGYAVKGEIGGRDLVALKGEEPPIMVIGELKQSFNLKLILQGVDRAAASDEIWLAARLSARGKGRESDPRFRHLCRRLGFGLLGVTADGAVQLLVSPTASLPRKDPKRRSRLVEEHRRRVGDPAIGGGSRQPIMTAYRQRALACAAALADEPKRPRELKPVASDALPILRRNVYGWFVRVERGVYALAEVGRAACGVAAHGELGT